MKDLKELWPLLLVGGALFVFDCWAVYCVLSAPYPYKPQCQQGCHATDELPGLG